MAALTDAQEPSLVELSDLNAGQLEPLLAEEAIGWSEALDWDFTQSAELVKRFVTTKTLGFVVIALVAAAVAGYYLFPYIIYADFAHKDELITGEGRAGIYTGFPSIPLNICQAASAALMGVILDLPEILEVPGHPGEYVSLGYQLWGPISALFILLAVIVLQWVDLDPDFNALAQLHAQGPEDETEEAADFSFEG